jgi:SAM-dependent methyltransferase
MGNSKAGPARHLSGGASGVYRAPGRSPGQHPGAEKTYDDAVASGFYQRDHGGLQGKYDNVRRYWEDQITRFALHGFVEPLVTAKRRSLSRIRVVDLGAGSGEGYSILSSLKKTGGDVASKEVDVLPADILGLYKGIDISEAMVQQGSRIYEDDPKVDFAQGDLSEGLPSLKSDSPFDIYFSSYGSLSHLRDKEMERLLADLADHMDGECIFVADLIGRYSFEWQCYWDQPTDETNMRQYSMSYLYPEEMLDKVEVERFPLRYWGAKEYDAFVEDILRKRGCRVGKSKLIDRSVLVGRHMNTGEFNPHAQPIRNAVNTLHEFNHRTDLKSLLFDYVPRSGFPELNAFFESFQMAWNAVVYAAIEALSRWDDTEWLSRPPPDDYPATVREYISTIRDVVRNVRWFRMGDPRANVIEPQLGYILRNLEMDFQQGLGTGHGLLAIYRIQKERAPA